MGCGSSKTSTFDSPALSLKGLTPPLPVYDSSECHSGSDKMQNDGICNRSDSRQRLENSQLPQRPPHNLLSDYKCHSEINLNSEPRFLINDLAVPKKSARQLINELKDGELFCDPEFPAEPFSITYSIECDPSIVWKRPKDIVPPDTEPLLIADGASREDIKQGMVGDCWFLSACAAVIQHEKFAKKIIPEVVPLCGADYKGYVHFCLWRFGKWVDVYIDDLLPTKNGKLIFVHSEDESEFWIALLEKAYAKLCGSYEAIEGGQTMDALVDLTGGLAERYEIQGPCYKLLANLERAFRCGAFVACSRKGDWRNSYEEDENGLVAGHAYTVTNTTRIVHSKGSTILVRVRNPWGDGTEWKGSWSDSDENWDWVDEETKEKLNFCVDADGEFWMSYPDFCYHFHEVTICTFGADTCELSDSGYLKSLNGEWVIGKNAGGSRNNLQCFALNPQYVLSLKESDDVDETNFDPELEGKCSVIIALMQMKDGLNCHSVNDMHQIGFVLYKVDDASRRLPEKHFRFVYETCKSGVYINFREISARFDVEPGHYVLIPSTFHNNSAAKFMIRIFAQKEFEFRQLPDT